MSWDDVGKKLKVSLNGLIREDNQRLSQFGWVPGPDDPYLPSWKKSTQYGKLIINLCGKASEEFYPGKEGHALLFSIGYSMSEIHNLHGEEFYEGYPAELCEPTDKPFIVSTRPMKEEELEDLCQKFVTELQDFPNEELALTLRQDLDEYRSYALEALPESWERYKQRKNENE